MSIDEIVKVYSPYQVIGVFEKFWRVIPTNRLNSIGEVVHPDFFVPLEKLYKEMKRRYPLVAGMLDSQRERDERNRGREENVWSKLSKEQFLSSVMK